VREDIGKGKEGLGATSEREEENGGWADNVMKRGWGGGWGEREMRDGLKMGRGLGEVVVSGRGGSKWEGLGKERDEGWTEDMIKVEGLKI
jgi:hypothetical protein